MFTTLSARETADMAALLPIRAALGGTFHPDTLMAQLGWAGPDGTTRVFITTDTAGAGYQVSTREPDWDLYGRITGWHYRCQDTITAWGNSTATEIAVSRVRNELRTAGMAPNPAPVYS